MRRFAAQRVMRGKRLRTRTGKDKRMSEGRDLEGLTALVTGATSGVGQAAAVQLARHGADVIVHGRDRDRGAAVAGAITAAGGTARFAAADLTDPAQLGDLAGQAGSAGVLVNNAGFTWIGPTADLDAAPPRAPWQR
jgi:short-subunit dehydrogenase